MEINKDTLFPYLIYSKPIAYNEKIILYPVTMQDIIRFQILSASIIVRKNSTFRDKKIIKMTYLEFLLYASTHKELEKQYDIPNLSNYYLYAVRLLQLCCKTSEVALSDNGDIFLNDFLITAQVFDELRRIIILQNGIEFDIDEFLNYETEQRLIKAEEAMNKNVDRADIEDYIDSLVIILNTTEEVISNMTIRKFWRYVKRYKLCETYKILKSGEASGMVKYNQPIKYWMVSLDENDKYKNLKTDENELKGKMG